MTPSPWEVIAIAFAAAILTSLISKLMVDQRKLSDIQKRIKEYQKGYGDARKGGDKAALDRMEKDQHEMLKLTKEMFMMNMKPMWVTMLPLLGLLWYLNERYAGAAAVATVLGVELSWFWLYFLAVVPVSMVFDKVYKKVKGL